jgi:sperm-associated antigen 16 protein
MAAVEDGLQVLERVELSDDEEDDFQYEHVDEDFGPDDEDENDDLADALATLSAKQQNNGSRTLNETSVNLSNTITQVRPSVVDDFVRNFLVKAGLKRSLETFNTEWYEMQSKGKLPSELSSNVPDIYLRNDELSQQASALREQVEKMREVATRAQATWDKFRKERDFHRMHHKRVAQEKEGVVKDLKRLRNHLRSYEPTLEELKRKNDSAMKEKMLIKLERDRLRARVKVLEEQVANLSEGRMEPETSQVTKSRSATRSVRKHASFPAEDSQTSNPFAGFEFDPAGLEDMQTRKSQKGHLNSVSACAFHPKKPIFATASDDETWKLWTVPDCELVMSGEGHSGWLSGVHFHPYGSHLATSSGDGTIKIWEFATAKCTHTFSEHSQAVWGCEFHYAGDFVASCSMDHTVRIWDLISGKCRQTLRGHVDSVNTVQWIPFTNNVASASGDKTVSVWDARTGLCVQTLYGHSNSVNGLCVNNLGTTIISCDADGVVKSWDTRMVAELGRVEVGQHPLNSVSVDRSGNKCVIASDDGSVKIVDLLKNEVIGELTGHDNAVQAICMAPNDAYMVSGSSDTTFRLWA